MTKKREEKGSVFTGYIVYTVLVYSQQMVVGLQALFSANYKYKEFWGTLVENLNLAKKQVSKNKWSKLAF